MSELSVLTIEKETECEKSGIFSRTSPMSVFALMGKIQVISLFPTQCEHARFGIECNSLDLSYFFRLSRVFFCLGAQVLLSFSRRESSRVWISSGDRAHISSLSIMSSQFDSFYHRKNSSFSIADYFEFSTSSSSEDASNFKSRSLFSFDVV